jgi:hypothetical protein
MVKSWARSRTPLIHSLGECRWPFSKSLVLFRVYSHAFSPIPSVAYAESHVSLVDALWCTCSLKHTLFSPLSTPSPFHRCCNKYKVVFSPLMPCHAVGSISAE